MGEFKADKMHGFGKMLFDDGSEYEGEWINGMKQGKGVERSGKGTKNEKTFKGLFEMNMRIGPDWGSIVEQY